MNLLQNPELFKSNSNKGKKSIYKIYNDYKKLEFKCRSCITPCFIVDISYFTLYSDCI